MSSLLPESSSLTLIGGNGERSLFPKHGLLGQPASRRASHAGAQARRGSGAGRGRGHQSQRCQECPGENGGNQNPSSSRARLCRSGGLRRSPLGRQEGFWNRRESRLWQGWQPCRIRGRPRGGAGGNAPGIQLRASHCDWLGVSHRLRCHSPNGRSEARRDRAGHRDHGGRWVGCGKNCGLERGEGAGNSCGRVETSESEAILPWWNGSISKLVLCRNR